MPAHAPGTRTQCRSCGVEPGRHTAGLRAADETVKMWDASSGQCLLTLRGHRGFVLSCDWKLDGARLASGSSDGSVKVWDAASRALPPSLSRDMKRVACCAWSPGRVAADLRLE